jgi:hypothetical protein
MLVGVRIPEAGALMAGAPAALGCLGRALFKQKLTHADIIKVPIPFPSQNPVLLHCQVAGTWSMRWVPLDSKPLASRRRRCRRAW